MRFRSIMLCAAVAPLLVCNAANAERVIDASLRLAIEIPNDWSELPTAEVNKGSGGSFDKDNPEIAKAVRKHGFIPNHLFGRTPQPDSPFSASINLSIQPAAPLKGESDQQALLTFLAHLASSAQQMPNTNVVTAPEIVTLAGQPAGHWMLTSSLKFGDSSIPISIEDWVILRDLHYVVVGASYHSDPSKGDRAEVMKIVNSLKFTDSPATVR